MKFIILLQKEIEMSKYDVEDYSSEPEHGNSHYNGVPSWYGKHAMEQYRMQPKYCEPGLAGDAMEGEKRNTQIGPKIL